MPQQAPVKGKETGTQRCAQEQRRDRRERRKTKDEDERPKHHAVRANKYGQAGLEPRHSDTSDLAKFYQDWGPDLCESRRRARSPIGVPFECPYQHSPWSPGSIGKPAPKIHQWTIYLCRWGFGWVDKAQCFRSARRFGAAGSSPDFSRVFRDMQLLGLCLELSFNY